MSQSIIEPPILSTIQIQLLEQLCNASGVSGDEGEVRQIVIEQVRPIADEIKVDALGNVLVTKVGKGKNRPRVMVAAHMDEVGLMVTRDEGKGLFRFSVVGSIDADQLAGKAVLIGRGRIPGVIGINPLNLTKAEERKQPLSLDALRIDVTPGGTKITTGDRAIFATRFSHLGPSLRAKALDDRLGVASLIELVKSAPPNIDLLAAFTVQEEIGYRGARVAAYAFDPDMALILDCTPAYDLPQGSLPSHGDEDEEEITRYNTRLGAGPAIYIADRATLSDPRLVRHLAQTAEDLGIPFQFRQPGGGGTDAGAIHKQRAGIPSVSLSVPGRYLHTPAGIARLSDWEGTLKLAWHALSRLSPETLGQERE